MKKKMKMRVEKAQKNKRLFEMDGFVTVKEAARIFNVTTKTIRKWSNENKIKILRHPYNNYRMFLKKDLEEIKKKIFILNE